MLKSLDNYKFTLREKLQPYRDKLINHLDFIFMNPNSDNLIAEIKQEFPERFQDITQEYITPLHILNADYVKGVKDNIF